MAAVARQDQPASGAGGESSIPLGGAGAPAPLSIDVQIAHSVREAKGKLSLQFFGTQSKADLEEDLEAGKVSSIQLVLDRQDGDRPERWELTGRRALAPASMLQGSDLILGFGGPANLLSGNDVQTVICGSVHRPWLLPMVACPPSLAWSDVVARHPEAEKDICLRCAYLHLSAMMLYVAQHKARKSSCKTKFLDVLKQKKVFWGTCFCRPTYLEPKEGMRAVHDYVEDFGGTLCTLPSQVMREPGLAKWNLNGGRFKACSFSRLGMFRNPTGIPQRFWKLRKNTAAIRGEANLELAKNFLTMKCPPLRRWTGNPILVIDPLITSPDILTRRIDDEFGPLFEVYESVFDRMDSASRGDYALVVIRDHPGVASDVCMDMKRLTFGNLLLLDEKDDLVEKTLERLRQMRDRFVLPRKLAILIEACALQHISPVVIPAPHHLILFVNFGDNEKWGNVSLTPMKVGAPSVLEPGSSLAIVSHGLCAIQFEAKSVKGNDSWTALGMLFGGVTQRPSFKEIFSFYMRTRSRWLTVNSDVSIRPGARATGVLVDGQ